jgi:hypothetical protein
MDEWAEGYVTDVPYLHMFIQETAPTWLAAVAVLLGHRPPDLARSFRYAD